ncbi:hypothetical protein BT69DRAFT_1341572 [Atractiella rhizophila]|nr:hypothetical protein BT69DRAFT_1341572 [Atractiella rhizophila]
MSSRPDLHGQKYDRQLRLWAASGQSALENADILVINATAAAASTLKNLVLPGVGSFTVIDPNIVQESDIGSNFFLSKESLGRPRAEEELSTVTDESFLSSFSLVILVDDDHKFALKLADICWNLDVPLVVLQSHGFYSALRVQARELCFIETHPDSYEDLRLDSPFPSLIDFCKAYSSQSMDSMEHAHIPYVAILVNELERWKSSHNGELPKDFKERNELKASILKQKRGNDEENFDEADEKCENLTKQSTLFWTMLRALRDFVRSPVADDGGGGRLPLHGSVPDMKAETKVFVDLQKVYRDQSEIEFQSFRKHFERVSRSTGVDASVDVDVLPDLQQSLKSITSDDLSGLYAAFRVVNHFNVARGRYPSSVVEEDKAELKALSIKLLHLEQTSTDEFISEM